MDVWEQSMVDKFEIWVDEKEKIVSFHPIENSDSINFQEHTHFLSYVQALAERSYRFQ